MRCIPPAHDGEHAQVHKLSSRIVRSGRPNSLNVSDKREAYRRSAGSMNPGTIHNRVPSARPATAIKGCQYASGTASTYRPKLKKLLRASAFCVASFAEFAVPVRWKCRVTEPERTTNAKPLTRSSPA